MVQVVKWYFLVFYVGRKGLVVKKLYNFILGEIFQCYWILLNDIEENIELVLEGLVFWVFKNSVIFVVEQVFYYLFILVFYVECFNKKI